MKSNPWVALPAAVLSTLVSSSAAGTDRIPAEPIGNLSAYPTVVQTGTKPTLTWNILYPSVLLGGSNGNGNGGGNSGGGGTVGQITPPGTITITEKNIYVSVQPIGTGPTACEPGDATANYNTEARISINGGAYQQLFYGNQNDVNSAYSLYIKKHGVGDTIDFAGRYVKNGSWTPLYTSLSSNWQVVTLVNGDTPPTNIPLYQSSHLKNYLKPYLDSTGKIKIGPLSAIVMMELGQTDRGQPCFDCQDMVLLVTLSTKHSNNGHGNNLDGVDSSNPGKGGGGPNGRVDPSGGVDDERR